MRIDRPSLPLPTDLARVDSSAPSLTLTDAAPPHLDDFERRPTLEGPPRATSAEALEALLASRETQRAPAPPESNAQVALGWGARVGNAEAGRTVENQQAALANLHEFQAKLGDVKAAYHAWKQQNPTAPEPSDGQYTMGQIVDGDLPIAEQCLRLMMLVMHERPETVNELQAAAPAAGVSSSTSSAPTSAPAAGQNPLSGIAQMLGPICQIAGPIASIVGGVLASPFGPAILGGAAAALGVVFPPALALVPIAATAAPIAGAALMGLGGVATGAGSLMGKSSAPVPQPGAPVDPNAIAGSIGPMLSAIAPLASAL
jgi:hypothetical protein